MCASAGTPGGAAAPSEPGGAWDAAAGWLLIEEAGGQAWSLDAHPWFASQALAAAATPALRDEFMRQLRHAVTS